MRSWVEKLAKLIETEGVCISKSGYKVRDYEIWFTIDHFSYMTVTNKVTEERIYTLLYEKESDLIKKALERCKEKTTDSIIEQINNL